MYTVLYGSGSQTFSVRSITLLKFPKTLIEHF